MNSTSFVFDTPTAGRLTLKMAAKRYTWMLSDVGPRQPSDVTLLLMHGLGQHKEQWEPMLKRMWDVQSLGLTQSRIREAWAFDWQSHGDSAVLNEDILRDNSETIPVSVWGAGVEAFMKEGHVDGHNLIGVGFSVGTIALLNSVRNLSVAQTPFHGIVLVEPVLFDQQTLEATSEQLNFVADIMTKSIKYQPSTFKNKEAAFKDLAKRPPYNIWDPRVLECFTEYALRPGTDKEGKECLVRKCPKEQEASAFLNHVDTFNAIAQIERLCNQIPLHVVFGAKDELLPILCKDSVIDVSKGRKVASITRMADASHMVPQEKPNELAKIISGILDGLVADSSSSVARL